LAETGVKAEKEAKAGIGTSGAEAEAETGVALAMETFGIVGIVGTEAGTIEITEPARAEVEAEIGVAFRKAFSSYIQLNKNSI
jgi:hypothetical protein